VAIEIKRYPKLNEIGRSERTQIGGWFVKKRAVCLMMDIIPKELVREFIQYAECVFFKYIPKLIFLGTLSQHWLLTPNIAALGVLLLFQKRLA
jgi:hypothetical protein